MHTRLPQAVWDAKEGYCAGVDAGGGGSRVESFSGKDGGSSGQGGGKSGGKSGGK